MYITECTFRPCDAAGMVFLPFDANSEFTAELRVTFQPVAYYPAEPDTGAGPDFDAKIVRIEIRDALDDLSEKAWHKLEPRDAAAARRFLDEYCSESMWDQAFEETAEAFGADAYRCAA